MAFLEILFYLLPYSYFFQNDRLSILMLKTTESFFVLRVYSRFASGCFSIPFLIEFPRNYVNEIQFLNNFLIFQPFPII